MARAIEWLLALAVSGNAAALSVRMEHESVCLRGELDQAAYFENEQQTQPGGTYLLLTLDQPADFLVDPGSPTGAASVLQASKVQLLTSDWPRQSLQRSVVVCGAPWPALVPPEVLDVVLKDVVFYQPESIAP